MAKKKQNPKGKPLKSADPNTEVTGHDTAPFNVLDTENTLAKDMRKARSLEAVLVIIRGAHQGRQITLDGDRFILGRSLEADIHFDEKSISKNHAMIAKEGDDFFIQDLNSTNGVFINEERIKKKVKLKKEDMITIGNSILKYVPAGELEIMYHGSLAEAAHTDKLTGLYNQNYMTEAFDAELKRAKALHSAFSIVVFDIDNFKRINDTYGHQTGDYVLSEVAKTVGEEVLRESDTFGRFGGDEFLVLLWANQLKSAARVAEQIRRRIENHDFYFDGQLFSCTISVGVATKTPTVDGRDALYKAADKALYQSKDDGKNRVSLVLGSSGILANAKTVKFMQTDHEIMLTKPKTGEVFIIHEVDGTVETVEEVAARKATEQKKAS